MTGIRQWLLIWLIVFTGLLAACDSPELLDVNATATTHAQQTITRAAALTPSPTMFLSPTPTLDPLITPSATPCTPRTDWQETYTVQSGDTISGIAVAAGVNMRDLQAANCLTDRDFIRVGDVLLVPNALAVNIANSPQGIEAVIVFLRQNEDGTQDLWSVKVDSTALSQITRSGDIVGQASRTLDYEWIAYRTASPFFWQIGDPLTSTVPSDIWVMRADGTNPLQIAEQGPTEGLIRSLPMWSPAGTQLAYTEQVNERGSLVLINADGTQRFVLLADDFTAPNEVVPIAPAWSPDGTQLAYITWQASRPFLHVMTLADRTITTFNSGFLYTAGPYWVPLAGEMGAPAIAYAVQEAGEHVWKVVNPRTSETLTRRGGAWLVSSDVGWRLRVDGAGLSLFTATGEAYTNKPLPPDPSAFSWGSISGQYVVANDTGLRLFDLTTNFELQLTTGADSLPLWSPPLWLVLP